MLESYVVQHGAPTLAGLKTGSLFSVPIDCCGDYHREIYSMNRKLRSKGLRIVPIEVQDTFILLYLYRPAFLFRDINRAESAEILHRKGYCCENSERCVAQLSQHLREDKTFPHEIGLFLGYPVQDVLGFMENPKKNYLLIGYWKVYAHKEEAMRTFRKFDRCKEIYCREIRRGRPFEQLAVATDRLVS